uniref:NifW n=1 Tax=Rhizobium fredii TaxID=380 RepID=O85711_RHIFR|nr:NifW [Sinorhizobium fredii HH103]
MSELFYAVSAVQELASALLFLV